MSLAAVQGVFGVENTMNFVEHRLSYYDGGCFGHHQMFTKDVRGRELRCNSFAYDFYLHEDYKRIVEEAALRDGLAWHKLKRFQLLLVMVSKAMKDVSSLKVMQSAINEEVDDQIKEFEGSLQKLRQHKFSVYRRQGQFWMDSDGKLWKKWEIEKFKNDLRLQAIGDDFVMAIQDLAKDFETKFKNIVPIGPISNYHQLATQSNAAAATAAAATVIVNAADGKSGSNSKSSSPSKQNKKAATASSATTTTTASAAKQ